LISCIQRRNDQTGNQSWQSSIIVVLVPGTIMFFFTCLKKKRLFLKYFSFSVVFISKSALKETNYKVKNE